MHSDWERGMINHIEYVHTYTDLIIQASTAASRSCLSLLCVLPSLILTSALGDACLILLIVWKSELWLREAE